MQKINLVVIGLVVALAQPCLADNPAPAPATADATGNSQQRMQAFQSMTPQQRQAAMETMRNTMQDGSGGMRARIRARMGNGSMMGGE